MNAQEVRIMMKNIFTPVRLKKAAALTVLCGILTAGGAYVHNERAQAHDRIEAQARTDMIMAQAAQRGVTLLDTERIQALTAAAIGKDPSSITYRKVKLTMKHHARGKHEGKRDHNGRVHDQRAEMQQGVPSANAADSTNVQSDFRPVYKVTCYVDGIKYKLRFDAVTGDVLSSKVDYDGDDVF